MKTLVYNGNMLEHPYYPGSVYATSPDLSRSWCDRLMLGGRWWVYARQFHIVLRDSLSARRGRYGYEEWVESSREVLFVLERSGARVRIEGLEHLQQTPGPVVVVANHMSTLETFALPAIIAPIHLSTFVVKEKLVRGPIFGPIMRSRNPIAVGRKDPRADLQTVMREGVRRLQEGMSLIIFPQATRSAHFCPERFNTLGLKLAEKAGVPLIPLALRTDYWGDGKLLHGFGPLNRKAPIRFRFAPPLYPTPQNRKEVHQATLGFISASLTEWGLPPVTEAEASPAV